ncbi:MAG: DUF262 domain-containing protein [Oscillospiraceae bacterium]
MTFDIKSNKESHTITWLKSQNDAEKLNKAISIQRKEVWDAEKKSNLIVSLLLDIPVESLLFEETDEGYNVLDGKQRTLSICAYLDDAFALSDKIRVSKIGDIELIDKRFSELPASMRNKITEYELSIATLRPLNCEERAMVFFMRNQAVALSKMDLSRVMLGEDAMNTLTNLCAHPFFTDKIKLTEPARRKNEDLQMLLQYMIVDKGDQSGLSGKAIMSLCDDIKNGEVALDAGEIKGLMDYLNDAVLEKKQYLKKAQIPIVMSIGAAAKAQGVPATEFGARLDRFFETIQPDGEYMQACKSGSAKKANVQLRMDTMREKVLG